MTESTAVDGPPPSQSLADWEAHLLTYSLSEWQQSLLRHFREHTEKEAGLLEVYASLADRSPTDFIGYLLTMLLEDERRHHRMFQELANALVGEANLTHIEPAIPPVSPVSDAGELRDITMRLLRLEEEDQRELHRLHKQLKPVRDMSLWDLLVTLAERDTEKHRLILRFVHDHATAAARKEHA